MHTATLRDCSEHVPGNMSRTFRTSRHAMDRALLVAVPPEQAPDAPVDPLKWSFHCELRVLSAQTL